ncbi:MAG: MerR family transcriptional regulator [Clostridia bacterium]|nr:MerR family transcriptional regulator [Clostridia bacterium]
MYKIGDLTKKFNLSRSTILYYDKLGLLKPAKRAENNYRLYDEQQVNKLAQIVMYRKSGVSLKNIKKLVETENDEAAEILIERLHKIQKEIADLKNQERLVLDVLKEKVIIGKNTAFTNKTWTEMLTNLGYEKKDWLHWHREFEADCPDKHYRFLKNLNMSDEDINYLLLSIQNI